MLNFRYASPQSSSINIISVKTPTNIKNASLCSKNSTIKIIKNSSVFANEQPSYNYPLSASIEERKMLLSTPYLKARNSRYSITMNLSNRRSILYETDLKSSQFKEDYIKHLQKENPSLNNDNDVEITKRILQNFQKVRDKNETLFLKKIFEPLNYFIDLKENLDETSYEDCFNNLYYETAEKNKYLYRIGEPTRKIFVLVRGEVVIMMPNPKEDKNDNEYSQNKTSPSHKRNSQQIKSANDFSPPDQKFIRSYAQGDVFGDDSFNVKGERLIKF